MKLAMDCEIGRSGLSTTLSGRIDDWTSFYTVIHIMQDNAGFTVTHSHHTIAMEKGRTPSHDDDYLKSSALKDLERLGVRGGGTSYEGNICSDQSKARGRQSKKEGGTSYSSLSQDFNPPKDMRGSKKQKSEGPGSGDSSISGQVPSIPDIAKLVGYIEHLSGSFDLPAHEKMMFDKNVIKLAMDCEFGRSGLSTTLSGRIDDQTSFYTVIHVMQDNVGFTVTHSHHTIAMEKGQTPSHDDDYLRSSALKDLARFGVRGAGSSYRGNIRMDHFMEADGASKTTINPQGGGQQQPQIPRKPTPMRGNKIQQSEGAADNKDPEPRMSACTDDTKKTFWR